MCGAYPGRVDQCALHVRQGGGRGQFRALISPPARGMLRRRSSRHSGQPLRPQRLERLASSLAHVCARVCAGQVRRRGPQRACGRLDCQRRWVSGLHCSQGGCSSNRGTAARAQTRAHTHTDTSRARAHCVSPSPACLHPRRRRAMRLWTWRGASPSRHRCPHRQSTWQQRGLLNEGQAAFRSVTFAAEMD